MADSPRAAAVSVAEARRADGSAGGDGRAFMYTKGHANIRSATARYSSSALRSDLRRDGGGGSHQALHPWRSHPSHCVDFDHTALNGPR